MDQKSQASFIPKKTLIKKGAGKKKPISLVLLVSTIIFFVTIAIGGGIYLYKVTIENQVKVDNKNLVDNQETFDPTTIVDLDRLDKRIILAQDLLSKHIMSSVIFDTLEELTLKSVRFNEFTYSVNSKGIIEITANGEALGYGSVALQSDIFGGNKYIKDEIFSGLSLNEKGQVIFDFSATIDPLLILYSENL